jgi:hypothetical protein
VVDQSHFSGWFVLVVTFWAFCPACGVRPDEYPALDYPRLARNEAFVALLQRIGGLRTRQALRAHLLRSPLGTESIGESPSSVAGMAPVDKFASTTDVESLMDETSSSLSHHQ